MSINTLTIDEKDHDREWVSLVKVVHLFRVIFSERATKALEFVGNFWNINFEAHKENWKRWIILDIDDCVAHHHCEILPENIEIIKSLITSWWKIIIFSNMKKSNRYHKLEEMWIEVVTSRYSKPDKRWFEECLKRLSLKPEETLMVWDNFLTDWWAIMAWIDFIKVTPLLWVEVEKKIKRAMQVFFRKTIDLLAERRQKYAN